MFTPLEKANDFNGLSLPLEADADLILRQGSGLMVSSVEPLILPPAQSARELCPLAGLTLKSEQTIIKAIFFAEQELKKNSQNLARQEAELLLSFLLQCERIDLYLEKGKTIPQEIFNNFIQLVEKRKFGFPLQYLINETCFFGLKFFVQEGVFIPRPETEVLVEQVIKTIQANFQKQVEILELCTGCGNIAVSLTKYIPNCKIVATDISSLALELAAQNAKRHGVEARISFLAGDLFSALAQEEVLGKRFDIIIANPPYLSQRDFENLQPELHYEPRDALAGGKDGLNFYSRIIRAGERFLTRDGFLAFEFGDKHKQDIWEMLEKSKNFSQHDFFKDLNQIYRFVISRRIHG